MEYILDTNIATFILDGELWMREPAVLMRARPELNVCWKQARGDLATVPSFYEPLRRSVMAFEWFRESKPVTVLPLTVQTELSIAAQVSGIYMCGLVINNVL